ncbi:MAG TPA: hypothetical protein VKQ52_00470, partial [Puia sp.]|nr:hypothetical protein [Puia sp.]
MKVIITILAAWLAIGLPATPAAAPTAAQHPATASNPSTTQHRATAATPAAAQQTTPATAPPSAIAQHPAPAQHPAAAQDPAEPLRRAEAAFTDIMVHDIFSPPVASRIYLYTNIAAYETLVKAHPQQYSSLHGQVKGFPEIPAPKKTISFPVASVYAFLLVGKKLVFSDSAMQDSIHAILGSLRAGAPDAAGYKASLEYGQQVAAAIIAWAETDQYKETRRLPRYRISRQKDKWIPTPPVYMAAVEPYWNRIRPVTLDSAGQ